MINVAHITPFASIRRFSSTRCILVQNVKIIGFIDLKTTKEKCRRHGKRLKKDVKKYKYTDSKTEYKPGSKLKNQACKTIRP